ncbi:fatty acyl-CoA reductase wat-like isoform X2 [Vespula squamosa]|uniref:Fatty acyl-CoA reductase wat-like isoform X2 n=1 Tax=Vespula squamosa TaxID=30214 RepID=A0ABD2BAG1_VESSQ
MKFKEKMKSKTAINVRSLKDAIIVRNSKIVAIGFVHISTAYANCFIEESHDLSLNSDKLMNLRNCPTILHCDTFVCKCRLFALISHLFIKNILKDNYMVELLIGLQAVSILIGIF